MLLEFFFLRTLICSLSSSRAIDSCSTMCVDIVDILYCLHNYIHTYTVYIWSDAAATIYFAACFVWLLFEGGYYSRAATIQGGLLFEGGYYSRGATIQGGLLFEGGYYSRAATIRGRLLFEGGVFFFGKPGEIKDGWIRGDGCYSVDAVGNTHSLSLLLSAVGTTCTTQTVLALA